MDEGLLARVERLESLDQIRQLPAKYALSLDMRDLDAHVNLFAPDIRVSRDKIGRSHLKRWLDDTLRLQFTGTSHHIGGHIIEFRDPDHAFGVVYSKNEHETGPEWVIMQMLYWDEYERIDGGPVRPSARILEALRQVPVIQGRVRGDPAFEEQVDQLVVEPQPRSVHHARAVGEHPRPPDREPVGVDAEAMQEVDVFGGPVEVIAGDRTVRPSGHGS